MRSKILGIMGMLGMTALGCMTSETAHIDEGFPLDTPKYVYEDFHLKSDFSYPDSVEITDTTRYVARYPSFDDQQLQAFVNRAQLGADTANLNLVARQFIGEYEAFQDSFTYPRQWNSETNTQVSNMTSIYLSLQTDHYSYTGGAHGMYWTMFTHYWLPENKELHLGDLVDSTRMQDLLTMAEAHFWAQEAQNGEEMSPDFYFFEDEQFYLPDNLNFERDSLLFLYNIYEIKPYVFGTTELRIPYTDIQPFLSEKAKAIIIELNK